MGDQGRYLIVAVLGTISNKVWIVLGMIILMVIFYIFKKK